MEITFTMGVIDIYYVYFLVLDHRDGYGQSVDISTPIGWGRFQYEVLLVMAKSVCG